jgi:hypothetical protein
MLPIGADDRPDDGRPRVPGLLEPVEPRSEGAAALVLVTPRARQQELGRFIHGKGAGAE